MSDSSQPHVFVTGATGFLGAQLCKALVQQGFRVRALWRNPESYAARKLPEACERIRGDVLDGESMQSAMAGCAVLYHCAGKVSRDPADAETMYEVHLRGSEISLDCARAAGIQTAVVASTSGTIALQLSGDEVADESHSADLGLINRLPYYRSKHYAERAALAKDSADFRVVAVNPTLLLGPGDLNSASTLDVQRYIERPMPLVPKGGVSYVDARDVAKAMIVAAARGRGGARYLLTASNCTTRTFFSRVARLAGVSAPLGTLPPGDTSRKATRWLAEKLEKVVGRDERLPDPESIELAHFNWYADPSRAEAELDWNPRDAMATLADTIEDLHRRGVVEVPALSGQGHAQR